MPKRITILCVIALFLTAIALRSWLSTERHQPHPRVLLSLVKLTNTTTSSISPKAIISVSNRSDRPIEIAIDIPNLPSILSTNQTDGYAMPLGLAFRFGLIQTLTPTNSIGSHSTKTLLIPSSQFRIGSNQTQIPANSIEPNSGKVPLIPISTTNPLQVIVYWRDKMTMAQTQFQNTKQWLNSLQRWPVFTIEKKPIRYVVQELVIEPSPQFLLEPHEENIERQDFGD